MYHTQHPHRPGCAPERRRKMRPRTSGPVWAGCTNQQLHVRSDSPLNVSPFDRLFGFCTKYEVLVCTYVDPDIAYPWIIPYSILNDHEVIEFHISESKAFGMS